MDDSSTDARQLSRLSSVYQALSSLAPPSPGLSSSGFCSSDTSGSITFLLEDMDFEPPASLESQHCLSEDSIAPPAITKSYSAQSVGTMGTFGPAPGNVRSPATDNWTSTSYSSGNVNAIIYPDFQSVCSNEASSIITYREQDYLGSPDLVATLPSEGRPFPSPLSASCLQPLSRRAVSTSSSFYGNNGLPITGSQTLSNLRSPHATSPSSSPFGIGLPYNSSSSLNQRYFSAVLPLLRQLHAKDESWVSGHSQDGAFGRRELSGVPANGSDSVPCTPVTATTIMRHLMHPSSPSPDQPFGQATVTSYPRMSLDLQHAFLPKHLMWLKDIVVEMLIDQEGFRTVHPSFKLTGYSHRARPQYSDGDHTDAMAEFMPVSRQTFNFHNALFDSHPILRRLTVNGEISRDYISRQASLGLRNGVYTVRGTEASSLPASYASGPLSKFNNTGPNKLQWKFDYMVNDRVKVAGNVIEGEKTFTPLTFSCSPILLHPLQGKKVRLMHIMKKSVTPNLVAEKIEPPTLRNVPTASPLLPSNSRPSVQAGDSRHIKSHKWAMHRRTQSQAARKEVGSENIDLTKPHAAAIRASCSPQFRRRRASSAGEKRQDDASARRNKSAHTAESLLSQHIVSPALLSQLLDAHTPEYSLPIPRQKI